MGRLHGEPVLNHLEGGKMVSVFYLSTTSQHQDAAGTIEDRCERHRVVAWGRSADSIYRFAKNGSIIAIDGQIHNHEVSDENGAVNTSTEISAHRIVFIGNRVNYKEQFIEA